MANSGQRMFIYPCFISCNLKRKTCQSYKLHFPIVSTSHTSNFAKLTSNVRGEAMLLVFNIQVNTKVTYRTRRCVYIACPVALCQYFKIVFPRQFPVRNVT